MSFFPIHSANVRAPDDLIRDDGVYRLVVVHKYSFWKKNNIAEIVG